MKILSFQQARHLMADPMPPDKILEQIWRDITNLPKDAVYTVEEWKNMYQQYSTGEGITGAVANTVNDVILNVLSELWRFIYEYGYLIALFGGLTAFLLYVCGHKGALKWMWTLTVAYLVICAMGELL